jgi:leader peptidase (prepilin peptidase) / N-methyltransferase
MTPFPDWLAPVLAAPFIGSFLGTLVVRLPAGRSIAIGRSCCDHCGHALGFGDLVPIVSWLAARRRCRHCGAPLSLFYPAIELGALLIAAWAATVATGTMLWITCLLGWSLIALAATDLRDGILPDALTLPLIPLGLLAAFLVEPASVAAHAWGAVAGFASFAFVRWLYRVWRHRDGLGLGDVKLLAAAGAFVSWEGLASVVLIGAVTALALALAGAALGRRLALDQKLAFGPSLCLGIWLVWLYGPLR